MSEKFKVLAGKNYGSIGHISTSRLGPNDYQVHEGQSNICTTNAKGNTVYVQTKLDGSNVGVAKLEDGTLVPVGRSGFSAISSPYEMHHMFHNWAMERLSIFDKILEPGERICGEWLAQAHGTIYQLEDRSPFVPFDIMVSSKRVNYQDFYSRVVDFFETPDTMLGPISPEIAMSILDPYGAEEPEGVIYRVENKGVISFLAKWVQPNKIDGKYLASIPPIMNWLG